MVKKIFFFVFFILSGSFLSCCAGDKQDIAKVYNDNNYTYRQCANYIGYEVVALRNDQLTKIVSPTEFRGKPVVQFFIELNDKIEEVSLTEFIGSFYFKTNSFPEKLRAFYVDEKNPYYKSIDGNLYSRDGKILFRYAPGKTEEMFVVPNGVEIISTEAFKYCQYLKTIKLPDSVKDIGSYAFSHCSNLQDISISDNVDRIGEGAFEFCKLTKCVELPEKIDTLPNYIYRGCYNITDLVIPHNIKNIGEGAYMYCEGLLNIIIPNHINKIDAEAFSGCINLETIEIPSSVSMIERAAFSGCVNSKIILKSKPSDKWNPEWNVNGGTIYLQN